MSTMNITHTQQELSQLETDELHFVGYINIEYTTKDKMRTIPYLVPVFLRAREQEDNRSRILRLNGRLI